MGSYIIVSEATKTARLPIRVPFDLKVRCKGDYYKWSRLALSMWNEIAGILQGASTECVPTAPREFRTKVFFHPGLDLSLPVYI